MCFTGFVRNSTGLARNIDRIFGDATYHAFVVAPLEHFELDAHDMVKIAVRAMPWLGSGRLEPLGREVAGPLVAQPLPKVLAGSLSV